MIKKYFDRLAFGLTQSKHRKTVHFVLIASIILLQLIVILLWYNESVNEKKLQRIGDDIQFAEKTITEVDVANNDFNEAQINLQDYLQFRDAQSLERYFFLLDSMAIRLDSIYQKKIDNEKFKAIFTTQKSLQQSIIRLKTDIDSLFGTQVFDKKEIEVVPLQLKKMGYKDILNSVEVESHIEADSLARKGLFTRLMNAISGKIEIKKEILNQKVTMKYGKAEESGTIEEQLKNVFDNSDVYYQQQYRLIKNNYEKLRESDRNLMAVNRVLTEQSKSIFDQFNDYLGNFKSKSKNEYQQQLETNKSIRFYSILGIVFLMLVLTTLLLVFTRLAFENERKLMEAQSTIQQNLTFKNRIVGMLSHEIRSPLSLISIYSKKVSKKIEDVDTQEVFKSIQFTTNSLLVMVNQVLDFSKHEQTQLQLNKKEFDLHNELNQITYNLRNLVENSGNTLLVESNVNEVCEVFSDKTKIHQLLYNIIGNANKFTDDGVIKLLINAQKVTKKQYRIHFEVTDNGRGISPSDLENIFEGFYKGVVSDKVNDLVTGLGLNLCKELVELFDGSIDITSQVYQGTKVVFAINVDCK